MKIEILQRKMLKEDSDKLINAFKQIKQYKAIIKAKKAPYLKSDLIKLLKPEISSLRNDVINSLCTRFYTVKVKVGKFEAEETFTQYPTTDDIKSIKINMFAGMREQKQKRLVEKYGRIKYDKLFKVVKPTVKKFRGYEYELNGTTFIKPKSILNLLSDPTVQEKRLKQAKIPYDNKDYVGVELELICKLNRQELNKKMLEAKLAGVVYVKHDGSIRTEKDDEHVHEVTVLGKQTEINTIIQQVCNVLTSKEVGGYVNNSCGLHVHLDMRNRDSSQCYTKLFRALPVLASMVPKNRIDGESGTRYCKLNKYSKITEYDGDRYKAINDCALKSHKTLEVRLHSGSINPTKINNWINILCGIVDSHKVPTKSCTNVDDLFEKFDTINKDLMPYVVKRVDKFKDVTIDTRVDHFDVAS